MKSINYQFLALILAISIPATIQANPFNDEWTCYTSSQYKGSKKILKSGEYDNCSNWSYNSWKSNCCVRFQFYYKDGKKGEKVICGDVDDLKNEMKNWGNLKYGYQEGWKNIYKAVFYCEGIDHINANNHHNNYNDILKKGHCVAWKGSNYGQDYEGFTPGKRYDPKDLKYKFWSLHCPDNFEVYWVYRSKSGKEENYTCAGKISDLKTHFAKWNIHNKTNAWGYVQYFEIRKKGTAVTGYNNNNQEAYKNKEWYPKYRNGGYIVFAQYKYFDGKYSGKVPGDYNEKKLGFYPQSVFIPGYSIYLVIEYKGKDGKNKSLTLKESIADLGKHLYEQGVYQDFEKDPYKAITRLAVIRQ